MSAHLVCARCGARQDLRHTRFCCECGGLWELEGAPPFDPARIDRSEWSMFRYRACMPLEGDGWRAVTLGEGMTPLVRLDEHVRLKMEYAAPTLSFKDRGAVMLVWLCQCAGVTRVVQDSSGNAGGSVAAYCAKAGIDAEIFVPESTSPKKVAMIRAYGAAVHLVPGTRQDTADACLRRARETGAFYASHVYSPLFYQGTKTYVYEIYEQLGRLPAHLFIPVGNGTLFLGVTAALRDMQRTGLIDAPPRLFAVQSERCDPLARARDDGLCEVPCVRAQATLAEGIAVAQPARAPRLLREMEAFSVTPVRAREDDILPARAALARKGVFVEHTTAAVYAAYCAYTAAHGPLPDTLLPMCGAGLKSEK